MPLHDFHQLAVVAVGAQDVGDFVQRKVEAAQVRDDPRPLNLRLVVVAIALLLIDGGRRQKPLLVIEAERLDREPGDLRELADAEHKRPLRRQDAAAWPIRGPRRKDTASRKGRVKAKKWRKISRW